MSEIDASSPMALQAVKALALYMKAQKEAALAQVGTCQHKIHVGELLPVRIAACALEAALAQVGTRC